MEKEKAYLVYKDYILRIEMETYNGILLDYKLAYLEENKKKVAKMKETYRFRNHEVYKVSDFKNDFFDTVQERKDFQLEVNLLILNKKYH